MTSISALGILLIALSIDFIRIDADIKIIHYAENEFGKLWVYEQQGFRCLSFVKPNTFIDKQTCISLKNPLRASFAYHSMVLSGLFINKQPPQKILMIGLGGGLLAKQLRYLLPVSEIDLVEINPNVVKAANTLFFFREDEKMKIHIIDGMDFVDEAIQQAKSYDFIILDAFDSNYIPAKFITAEFINKIKSLLTSKGAVVANTFSASPTSELEISLFTNAFGNVYQLKKANRIIFASKATLPTPQEMADNSRSWQKNMDALGIDARYTIRSITSF
jgi:spermidine synthase